MAKPRIKLKCPAAGYASPHERIAEFGEGTDGSGGLIHIKRGRDGRLKVHLYRLENVDVTSEA